MFEIGKTFMYNGVEYRINHIGDKFNRIGLEQVGDDKVDHSVNQIIKIDDVSFKIIYIHTGKNRISIEPIRKKI